MYYQLIFGYDLKIENALWPSSTTMLKDTKLKTTAAHFSEIYFSNIILAEPWSKKIHKSFPVRFCLKFSRVCAVAGILAGIVRSRQPRPINVTNQVTSSRWRHLLAEALKQPPRLVKWSARKDKVKLTDTLIETSDPFKPCGRLQTSRHL